MYREREKERESERERKHAKVMFTSIMLAI